MSADFKTDKLEATILFCDIRNFTNLFEHKDPIKAVRFANSVLAELGKEIEEFGGTVDRFTGDGFLAHFGAFNKNKNHALDACRSALSMRNTLQEINNKRYHNVEQVVLTGTSIHTGEVAIGKIKTPQFDQLTVLGDVVNTASRIEELTKYFNIDIILSEDTWSHVSDEFQFQKMPDKELRGKDKKVSTYWFLPMNQL